MEKGLISKRTDNLLPSGSYLKLVVKVSPLLQTRLFNLVTKENGKWQHFCNGPLQFKKNYTVTLFSDFIFWPFEQTKVDDKVRSCPVKVLHVCLTGRWFHRHRGRKSGPFRQSLSIDGQ